MGAQVFVLRGSLREVGVIADNHLDTYILRAYATPPRVR